MALNRDLNALTDKVRNAAETLHNEFSDVFITETGRTIEQQKENIKKGVSWTMDSYHLMNPKARAFDIGFRGPELYPKDKSRWEPVWKRMKEMGMDNGHDMWGKDWMHFQDDGTTFNQKTMELSERDYKKIFDNNFDEGVLSDWDGDEAMSEGQIKALLDIYGQKLIRSNTFREFVIDIIKEELTN